MSSSASPTFGELEQPPFSRDPVRVVVFDGKELRLATESNLISETVEKIEKDFGVRIDQTVLAGYILDLTQVDGTNAERRGPDLDASFLTPLFAPFLHNHKPWDPDGAEGLKWRIRYALNPGSMSQEGELHKKKYRAPMILPEISHAFFPAFYFDETVYLNKRTGKSTGKAYEAVLHEALHIWDFRNHAKTDALLRSPGSFYDKRTRLGTSCPEMIDEFGRTMTGEFDKPVVCGISEKESIRKNLIEDLKWPRRFGPGTDRQRMVLRQGELLPFQPDPREGPAEVDYGDLHAMDNEREYFAILMQLFVFDREQFNKIATPAEHQFAKELFDEMKSQAAH